MKRILKPEERLIVAADFKPKMIRIGPVGPSSRDWVKTQVLALADSLKGTGVYLKVNSALRACGYDLIGEIQSRGLRVFADLKLYDIGETLSTDGVMLQEAKPELLTTVCSIGEKSLKSLKDVLPGTEVLGVTVLTNLSQKEVFDMYGRNRIEDAVLDLANLASRAGLDGLISSPAESEMLRGVFKGSMTINTPAIRPT